MKEARWEVAKEAQEKAKEGATKPKLTTKCRLDKPDEATKKTLILLDGDTSDDNS
jgi:hypothetical protein